MDYSQLMEMVDGTTFNAQVEFTLPVKKTTSFLTLMAEIEEFSQEIDPIEDDVLEFDQSIRIYYKIDSDGIWIMLESIYGTSDNPTFPELTELDKSAAIAFRTLKKEIKSL